MSIRHFGRLTVALVASILMVSTGLAMAASNKTQIRVGKKGEIALSQTTRIGDVTLPPGDYVFQHKVVGDDHFMTFVGGKEMDTTFGTVTRVGPIIRGEVKCIVVPLKDTAIQTAVVSVDSPGGTAKVNHIEIAGEKVAHLL